MSFNRGVAEDSGGKDIIAEDSGGKDIIAVGRGVIAVYKFVSSSIIFPKDVFKFETSSGVADATGVISVLPIITSGSGIESIGFGVVKAHLQHSKLFFQ